MNKWCLKGVDCMNSLNDRYYQYLLKIFNLCELKVDFPERVLYYILDTFWKYTIISEQS